MLNRGECVSTGGFGEVEAEEPVVAAQIEAVVGEGGIVRPLL